MCGNRCLMQTADSHMAWRAQAMTKVQRMIAEIGKMFQDFTQLIASQGEQLRMSVGAFTPVPG